MISVAQYWFGDYLSNQKHGGSGLDIFTVVNRGKRTTQESILGLLLLYLASLSSLAERYGGELPSLADHITMYSSSRSLSDLTNLPTDDDVERRNVLRSNDIYHWTYLNR